MSKLKFGPTFNMDACGDCPVQYTCAGGRFELAFKGAANNSEEVFSKHAEEAFDVFDGLGGEDKIDLHMRKLEADLRESKTEFNGAINVGNKFLHEVVTARITPADLEFNPDDLYLPAVETFEDGAPLIAKWLDTSNRTLTDVRQSVRRFVGEGVCRAIIATT